MSTSPRAAVPSPGVTSDRWLRITPSARIGLDELEWRVSRSGGPGGQHANTSDTRVEVSFDIAGSPSLGPRQRARLLDRLGPVVRAVAADTRSQARNREVALQVKPVPRSSRDQVRKAIAAVDHALHFVDHHYTGNEPTIYDHLEIRGGSGAILWMVRRGLAARDDDFKNHRPPMQFAD